MSTLGGEDAHDSPRPAVTHNLEDVNVIKMAHKIAESVTQPPMSWITGPFRLTVMLDQEAP